MDDSSPHRAMATHWTTSHLKSTTPVPVLTLSLWNTQEQDSVLLSHPDHSQRLRQAEDLLLKRLLVQRGSPHHPASYCQWFKHESLS